MLPTAREPAREHGTCNQSRLSRTALGSKKVNVPVHGSPEVLLGIVWFRLNHLMLSQASLQRI